jgi:protocatechuate 3,4-dioxygenase beta subunit
VHARYPVFTLIVGILLVLSDTTEASQSADQVGLGDSAAQITITGRVVDSQDRPVEGAKVTFYRMAYTETVSLPKVEIIQEKKTGRDGAFSLIVARHGDSYRPDFIVARKEGLSLGWAMVRTQADQRFDIVLGEPKNLGGEVVDEKGQPIVDAEVSIGLAMMGKVQDQHLLVAPAFLATKTDRNGHFLFANMPADGTFEFRVWKAGRVTLDTLAQAAFSASTPVSDIAQVASGRNKCQFSPGQTGIKLTLPLAARVEGMVVEKISGKPVGRAKVTAQATQRQDGFLPPDPVTTAEDGTFHIGGLAAGRWSVQLGTNRGRVAEREEEEVQVSLRAGETKSGVRLELTKAGTIEVLVVDGGGKPVGKADVDVHHIQRDQSFGGSTDENGIARIRVPSGQYRISGLHKRGYISDVRDEQSTVEEGKTKQVRSVLIATPEVTGTVRDEGGNPLAGIRVEVTPAGREPVVTGADGRFVVGWYAGLGGPQITSLLLVARDPTRNLAEIAEVDERTGSLDLILKPGVILTGTVLSQKGSPLAGARVEVLVRGPDRTVPLGLIEQVSTAENGTFEVKAVPPGRRCVVTATAAGYGSSDVSVDASDMKGNRYDIGQLKLVLADLSISGTVVDVHDKPVAGAVIFTAGGDLRMHTGIQTDADGKFVIKGVSSRPILLIASTRGPAPMHGSVWTEGGAIDVRIVVSE